MKKNYRQLHFLPTTKFRKWHHSAKTLAICLLVLFAGHSAASNPSEKPWNRKDISHELKDKRTRTSKHFLRADDKIAAYISPSSIHYLNDQNSWEEIDTRISVNTGANLITHPYASNRNSVKTYFPENPFTSYILMNTREGEFKERIVAVNFLDAAGQVISTLPLSGAIKAIVEGNRISYTGFHPYLSLEYTLGNDSRKFDLVIQSSGFLNNIPQGTQSIMIEEEFLTENTEATFGFEKGGITITSKGTSVFQIPQPVATGSNNEEEELTDGMISFKKEGDSRFIQSFFPMNWIKNSSRHFPVHLDPTVNYYPTNTTYWTGYQTSATSKTSGQIRVTSGLNQGWGKFDLSSLPIGCTVSQATYYGYHYSTTSTTKICQITGMGSVDPVSSTAGAIATQIPSGTVYNNNYTFGGATYSWNPGSINNAGLSDIAAAAGNWIGLGFSYVSGSTTFMYHYGINGYSQSPPKQCYIEVVYFTIPCNSVPSANSVVSPTYAICPGSSVVLALASTYSVGGITYQWLSSSSSSLGPFVAIPNGTSATITTPTVSTPTWFSVVITCSAVTGNYTATAGEVLVQSVTIDNVPYYESFENIIENDDLPNCSWSAAGLGTTALTYTTSNTGNRFPRTGNKFASFYYSPAGTSYFYTNGIQLNAGITYSASIWYTTEYMGYTNWSDLSILYGSAQSTTGLVTIASTNGPAVSNIYKQLSNTFQVPTSGIYYIAIKGTTGSGSAQYLSWDDLEINIPCSFNNPTVSLSASSNTICSGSQVVITATGADSYTWNTGSTSNILTENPSFTTTYTLTATNNVSGCSIKMYETIFVNASPEVLAYANPQTICSGETVGIAAFGASTYQWSQSGNGSYVTVNPLVTSTYSVTGYDPNGCSTQATVQIAVNPLPNVTITGPTSPIVCNGDLISLTANGASTFSWTDSNTQTIYAGSLLNIIIPGQTTYSVTGTDINGCENLASYVQVTSECTGLRELPGGVMSIAIFPNPNNGQFYINCDQAGEKTISLIDITGKIVYTFSSYDNNISLHAEHLASGLYTATVKCNSLVSVAKVVIH